MAVEHLAMELQLLLVTHGYDSSPQPLPATVAIAQEGLRAGR